MGQGAMLLSLGGAEAVAAVKNPFFLLAPEVLRLPLVILATLATIIASQAVISGAFSVTQQAIHLGFIPRMRILHTSESSVGQIYIPAINWALMVMVILLVLSFQTSSNLASAYGIAVTGAMFIDTCLLTVVLLALWKWRPLAAVPLLAVFFLVDGAYLAANLTKVPDGGWFPLLIGFIVFTLLTTWGTGRKWLAHRMREADMAIDPLVSSAVASASRASGTAIFMTSQTNGVPHAFTQNFRHNGVIHERCVFVRVAVEEVPYVPEDRVIEMQDLGNNLYRVTLQKGFMEDMNVPAVLRKLDLNGVPLDPDAASYFLSRQTPLASELKGMAIWRERLFAWMMRNAESPLEYFCLPSHRVVEMGAQVKI